jgi:hypothetical protein
MESVAARLSAAFLLVATCQLPLGALHAQSLQPLDRPSEMSNPTEGASIVPAPRNTGSLVPLSNAPSPSPPGSSVPIETHPDERDLPSGSRPCGLPAVKGQPLPAISKAGGCGIGRPVEIVRLAGVALTPALVVSCTTAVALEAWITGVAKPAFRRAGYPLLELQIAASYVCRNVNSAVDGNLSQHALGGAIDISGFRSTEGEINVREDWSEGKTGALLSQIYDGACGIFGTTLGPESDRHHQDHFHFDVAERDIPYCR